MAVVTNLKAFLAGVEGIMPRFEAKQRLRIKRLLNVAMSNLIRRTPVWTGQAVSAYTASVGSPVWYDGWHGPAEDGTNSMPLGPEEHRPAAAGVAMRTLRSAESINPWVRYYISNAAPHIGGLENGELPNGETYTPRSWGMFAITTQDIIAGLSTGRL